MKFASDDDDDDIYDSEYRLKEHADLASKRFNTIIKTSKIILLIYSITDINQSR